LISKNYNKIILDYFNIKILWYLLSDHAGFFFYIFFNNTNTEQFTMINKRTTYVLGATTLDIGLMFSLIWALPISVNEDLGATSALVGHATIVLADPDGTTTHYIQTDNTITDTCLSTAAIDLFGGFVAGTDNGPYNTLNVFTGPAVGPTLSIPTGLIASEKVMTTAGVAETGPAGGTLVIDIDFGTITVLSTDNGKFIESVALANAAGDFACSIIDLNTCGNSPGCGIVTGSTIVIDYKMTFT